MGQHNKHSGPGRDRSRNRGLPDNDYMRIPKPLRRARNRLADRRKFYDDVLSKSPRAKGYKRPGSMKARTN